MSLRIGITLDARQFKVELEQGDPLQPEPERKRPWYHVWVVAMAGIVTGLACSRLWLVW